MPYDGKIAEEYRRLLEAKRFYEARRFFDGNTDAIVMSQSAIAGYRNKLNVMARKAGKPRKDFPLNGDEDDSEAVPKLDHTIFQPDKSGGMNQRTGDAEINAFLEKRGGIPSEEGLGAMRTSGSQSRSERKGFRITSMMGVYRREPEIMSVPASEPVPGEPASPVADNRRFYRLYIESDGSVKEMPPEDAKALPNRDKAEGRLMEAGPAPGGSYAYAPVESSVPSVQAPSKVTKTMFQQTSELPPGVKESWTSNRSRRRDRRAHLQRMGDAAAPPNAAPMPRTAANASMGGWEAFDGGAPPVARATSSVVSLQLRNDSSDARFPVEAPPPREGGMGQRRAAVSESETDFVRRLGERHRSFGAARPEEFNFISRQRAGLFALHNHLKRFLGEDEVVGAISHTIHSLRTGDDDGEDDHLTFNEMEGFLGEAPGGFNFTARFGDGEFDANIGTHGGVRMRLRRPATGRGGSAQNYEFLRAR